MIINPHSISPAAGPADRLRRISRLDRRIISTRAAGFEASDVILSGSPTWEQLGGPFVTVRTLEHPNNAGRATVWISCQFEVLVGTNLTIMTAAFDDLGNGVQVSNDTLIGSGSYITVVSASPAQLPSAPGVRTIELRYFSSAPAGTHIRNRHMTVENF